MLWGGNISLLPDNFTVQHLILLQKGTENNSFLLLVLVTILIICRHLLYTISQYTVPG